MKWGKDMKIKKKKLTIKEHLHILYIKWLKGECRALCFRCDYKNECFSHYTFKEW